MKTKFNRVLMREWARNFRENRRTGLAYLRSSIPMDERATYWLLQAGRSLERAIQARDNPSL